jgi:signal peptide peptidase SppA
MNLHQLIAALYHEPALITPAAHASIRQLLEERGIVYASGPTDPESRAPGAGICGEKVEVEQPFVTEEGIAIVPVNGALGQSLKPFERGHGAVDTLDIRAELAQYAADPNVRAALMDFDSPGGMALGTPETAQAIQEFSKPIFAFTRGMIASAAYWLASATHGIFATPSSNIGSIGTVITYHDLAGMAEKRGIKVEVIRSGKYKGMGTPGTSLSADQRAFLQDRVDTLTREFKAHVRARRGEGVSDDVMQGQVLMAGEAQAAGLIDGIVRDRREVEMMLLQG